MIIKNFIDLFNARELATITWLALIIGYALLKGNVLKSLVDLFKILYQAKIYLLVFLLYVITEIYLLNYIWYWSTNYLKDTIFWFLFSGFALLMKTGNQNKNIMNEIFADIIKIILILEFILNLHSFPFLIEFLLAPIIVVMIFVKKLDNGNGDELVKKFADIITSIIGFAILFFSIYSITKEWESFYSFNTLYSFLLPIILSILLLPFLYFMIIYSKYENFFISLKIYRQFNVQMKNYFMWQILFHFNINYNKLIEFQGYIWTTNPTIKTKEDIKFLIKHFKIENTPLTNL